jgi:proteasome accessory factor A
VPAASARRARWLSISRCPRGAQPVDYQLSQRADHIVNDIYQWVQFNRAIINARDEPLADYRKYRRLHLLIGDSNMSPFATALKVGTTVLILTLLEEGDLPDDVILSDAVMATAPDLARRHRPRRGPAR